MEPGRGRTVCALWGGISLGIGTIAYALCSSSSAGCSTNLVVLTHGTVTARGCATFSAVSHFGVGLIVLGAVLLLGSFALALRNRRLAGAAAAAVRESGVGSARSTPVVSAPSPALVEPAPDPGDLRTLVSVGAAVAAPSPAAPSAGPAPVAPMPVPAPAPTWTPAPPTDPFPDPTFDPTFDPTPAGPVVTAAQPGVPPVTPPGLPIAPGEDSGDSEGLLASAIRLPPGWYGNPNHPGRPVQWWDGTKLTDRPT
jgi:hypothetical protein